MKKAIFIGFISGILSGLFASGGGLILVPALVHILKIEEKQARATSVFCILPMVITSSIFYYKNQYWDFKTGILCAIGGIIGGIIGAKLLKKVPDKYLSISFAIFLIYAGISIFFK